VDDAEDVLNRKSAAESHYMDKKLASVRASNCSKLADLIPAEHRFSGMGVSRKRGKLAVNQIDGLKMTKGTRLLNEVGELLKTGGRFAKTRTALNQTEINFTNLGSTIRMKDAGSSIKVGFLDTMEKGPGESSFLDYMPRKVEKARGDSSMFIAQNMTSEIDIDEGNFNCVSRI
jgi:hypothetical protein